jgi:hypothetical protein
MKDMTNLAFKGPVDFASASDMYGRNRKLVFMFKYEGK